MAELVSIEGEVPASLSVAAALPVLAGIAASDAACCAALGRRSRGQDHRQAIPLLEQVVGGRKAAQDLLRLLDLKDTTHYGVIHVTGPKLTRALRQAERLVQLAARVSAQL